MADGSFIERQQELEALATTPDVEWRLLEWEAWNVITRAVYGLSEDDINLLPTARPLVERLANDNEVRYADSDRFFDANITLATWSVLTNFARGEPISYDIRRSARQKLGQLMLDSTDGSFEVENLNKNTAQKLYEAHILSLLLRSRSSTGVFGLQSPPHLHYFEGVDEETGTSSFQLYAMTPENVVPVRVTRQRFPEELVQLSGVLDVVLIDLLFSVAVKLEPIMAHSRSLGSLSMGKRWIINMSTQTAAREVIDGIGVPLKSEEKMLDRVTTDLTKLVVGFDPLETQELYYTP